MHTRPCVFLCAGCRHNVGCGSAGHFNVDLMVRGLLLDPKGVRKRTALSGSMATRVDRGFWWARELEGAVVAKSSRSDRRGGAPGKRVRAANPSANGTNAALPARTRLIVGIGASAGGIDAFKAFFSKMPADSGMSFVLVQHLDPKYESSLVAIIGGYTPMPVTLAKNGAEVRPNQVYVIPPGAILTIKGGALRLSPPATPVARRTSINAFLMSLAEDQGENAIGIILAGFGSDGALGIAAIKEHGGLTLSQAEFDHHAKSGMPQSAASGGFVDHVLAVEDMPAALEDYRHHRAIYDAAKGPDGIRPDLPSHLTTICAVLHSRLGRDFSQYKTGTLMRRIQRRMTVLQIDDVSAYIEQLRTLPHEAELLFREILISVTRFFRDPEAFETLGANIIPGLAADSRNNEPIRVWAAGCATGEEAYSIAILLREELTRSDCRRPVQVFATDIDDRAIEVARAGLYSGTIASDMSAERLERNFVKEDSNYRVAKAIRGMCLFSVHDIVRDPPFSRLDLICCRNLMIYFDSPLQQRVLATFHYALRPNGHLFLGLSESVTAQSRLFAALDKRHRIYARRDVPGRLPALPPYRPAELSPPSKPILLPAREDIDRLAARAISRYTPAFIVVDHRDDIQRFSGPTAKYIEPTTGVASLNVFHLLHPDLRTPVRTGLKQAAAAGAAVLPGAVRFWVDGQYETVNLIVEPLPAADRQSWFMVAFQEVELAPSPNEGTEAPRREEDDTPAVQALHKELLETREHIRSLSEEMEASHEELQSSNEEYLSVNEELQSANEELETSKEELQSLNEELQTVNAELQHRNDALGRANSDLVYMFDSTSIATLFLDNDLRIRRFTPRLLDIFSIREGDQGRPISDIVSHLTRDWLGRDVKQVLRTLTPVEREVALTEGSVSYLMHVRPYRDLNDVIGGVVISFVDISERKRHEQARSLLAAIVESSRDAIISHDLHGAITSWNAGAEEISGYSATEAIGQSVSVLLAGTLPDDWPQMLARIEDGEQGSHFDASMKSKDGRSIEVSVRISAVREGDGRIVGASMVARDISERKAAEEKASLLLGELDHRVKNILAIVSAIVSQSLKTSPTPEAFAAEVEGRVRAIAAAHSLLTGTGEGEVSLRSLLATELAPYDRGNGNLAIAGRDIALAPRAGLALAMAVHELASNAAKYGALSTASAHLEIAWKVTGSVNDRKLRLVWTETGGPPVKPPARRGFGTTLIERTLAHELDAEVNREFLAAGHRCTISLPLTADIGRVQADSETRSERDDRR